MKNGKPEKVTRGKISSSKNSFFDLTEGKTRINVKILKCTSAPTLPPKGPNKRGGINEHNN
jgi:hypothetical protein